MPADLPPGWTLTRPEPGQLMLAGPSFSFQDGDLVEDEQAAQELAWTAWLAALPEMPDPVPLPAIRWLCVALADALSTGDAGRAHGSLGQRAAARALHVEDRTIRRWVSGERPMPWAAAELLRRLASPPA